MTQVTAQVTAQKEMTTPNMKLLVDLENSSMNVREIIEQWKTDRENSDYKVIEWNGLYLIKYLKNRFVCSDSPAGLMRSVVTDGENILAYSPSKSIEYDVFLKTNFIENCHMEEMVEGTMINVFWNHSTEEWMIATKSNLGGNNKFNTKKTFSEMFFEVLEDANITFEELNKKYSYSFVFQHPENRNVVPFHEKKLYLISVYSIDGSKIYTVENDWFENADMINKLHFPMEYKFDTFEEVCDVNTGFQFKKLYEPHEWQTLGVHFTNKDTGVRMKVRNELYEYIRQLKGNSYNIQHRFYELRRQKKIKEFLQYFPEYKDEFYLLEGELRSFTKKLHNAYVCVHIKHEKTIPELDYELKPHVYNLHGIYINSLRANGNIINFETVKSYINHMPEKKLMFAINYNKRTKKEKVEDVKETNVEDVKEKVE